jgi:hypothetical protein
VALHLVTLLLLFAAAWLLGSIVAEECDDARCGAVAALLFVTHPQTPASLAAWISQVFHLAPLLCALAAIRTWQHTRARGRAIGWAGVMAWLAAGVLFKEDTIMVVPALLLWHALRRRLIGDVPAITPRALVGMLAGVLAYAAWRLHVADVFTGYVNPSPMRFALNYTVAWVSTLGYQWTPTAHALGAITGPGLIALAVLARRAWPDAGPASKLVVGEGVVLGACVAVIVDTADGRRVLTSRLGTVVVTVWLIAAGTATVWHTRSFAPCAPDAIERDKVVLLWDILTPPLRHEIESRIAACTTP